MKGFKKQIWMLLLAVAFVGCNQHQEKKEQKGEVVKFDNRIAADASYAVMNRILKAKETPISEIKFEKGTYHFYPNKAYEMYRNISNHDDQLTVTPFPIVGLENITIDGQGSTFVFHGVMIPFIIHQSKNVSVKNLSIDWGMSFHSEGVVVANDQKNNTYDLQYSKEYPYEIRNGQLTFLKEYYSHNMGQSILFDPKTKAVAYATENYSNWFSVVKKVQVQQNLKEVKYPYKTDKQDPIHSYVGKEFKGYVKEVKPGVVRVFNHTKKLPKVGLILVSKGDKTVNRTSPGFHITETFGFNGNNVNINHAGGMGVIAENSADLILDNFNVVPSKGRMVSSTADATHFVGCRGKIQITNSTFNNQLDDAANIHGAYKEVFDVIDKHTIGIRSGHFQQKGFLLGYKGDKIALVREAESLSPYKTITLKSYKKINGRYAIATFEEELPERIIAGDLLENLDAYPEVVIKNCTISRNRARGLLLGSKKSTLVENNYFHTEMSAIVGPAHVDHWYEASVCANVTIKNNTFQDCAYGGPNQSVIVLTAEKDIKELTFKNIVIENNTFNQFDNLILDIDKTENLVFKGNTITNSGTFPQLHPKNPAFKVQKSKDIQFVDNTYKGTAKQILKSDNSVSNLKFQ
ncbi:hypothetical protein FHR24_001273 [Wenyingzhuangia heitensis]|uniref:Right handed beta helix region n=1 Tax=Wenyingzhuangia heitensis TaxID=1487859 RepID=A0ABX0U7L7_9FLAO|nr:right-handed parallel beta-helix repeat-containing protein [Wenyingzhuangia heitensis]NIJ44834.1 hypothetical protein [Wenyingzhuangia heitensis]